MRFLVLACDYDGTLAHGGAVDEATLAALVRCRESGRRVILVTGRELVDLAQNFPALEHFDYVVAENGATLYHPATREEKLLGERPPDAFVAALESRGVAPLSVGRVIVATWEPHETAVLQTIRDLGLELQVVFNKGAVMVMPSGLNKATGLQAALNELGMSAHNVVAIGDAENDHALLAAAEAGVAVANAIPTLAERADWVTEGRCGAGTTELIDRLIKNDLADLAPRLKRHHILLGHDVDGSAVTLRPYGINILISGTTGSGKSTLATALVERLAERHYQICVVDPEGDYENFLNAVVIGSPKQPPDFEKVQRVLADPRENVVVNLNAVPLADRPAGFMSLLSRLGELRAHTGHPHWIIVDEAHHVLPSSWEPTALAIPSHLDRMIFITLEESNMLAAPVLRAVDTVLAVGSDSQTTFQRFGQATDLPVPELTNVQLQAGEVLYWCIHEGSPKVVKLVPGQLERRRHSRKYAEGDLGPERSFYFRGPQGRLKLRAHNMIIFLLIAEGVDDETWLYHLRRGEYSKWFRESIKDGALAEEAARIEQSMADSADPSRTAIKTLLEEHYTLPGGPATPVTPR